MVSIYKFVVMISEVECPCYNCGAATVMFYCAINCLMVVVKLTVKITGGCLDRGVATEDFYNLSTERIKYLNFTSKHPKQLQVLIKILKRSKINKI